MQTTAFMWSVEYSSVSDSPSYFLIEIVIAQKPQNRHQVYKEDLYLDQQSQIIIKKETKSNEI